MIAETYVSGLNENISIYGLIAFMGKTNNKENKPPLIKPEPKLKFSLKKYAYKKKEFKLGKVHNKVGKIIYSNKIIEMLSSYKKHKFRFKIESLLYSTNLRNNAEVIVITCDGLSEAKTAFINSKLYKTLGVVYLSETKDWNLIKNDSKKLI